ncbi:MAG: hypothetical protein JNL97_11605, partial [Verrucomicrobiales bacterium]|nr:hypothetical protein [Verrucomicrobiales bacterium]
MSAPGSEVPELPSPSPGGGGKPDGPQAVGTDPGAAKAGAGQEPPYVHQNFTRWQLCRQVIEHEDNLVNHRLTWFLVINGFLMTACGASLGTLATADASRFQWAVFF